MSANRLMKTKHVPSRLLALLFLVACLMLCAWSAPSPASAASTLSTVEPAFAAKLRPLLEAKMKELRIPGAIFYRMPRLKAPALETWG
jgi:hypothetical protein